VELLGVRVVGFDSDTLAPISNPPAEPDRRPPWGA
jgi:hypothetical protein